MAVTKRQRINTAVRFPPDLHKLLSQAAAEHGVSLNFLVVRACEDFLPRLLSPRNVKWTKSG